MSLEEIFCTTKYKALNPGGYKVRKIREENKSVSTLLKVWNDIEIDSNTLILWYYQRKTILEAFLVVVKKRKITLTREGEQCKMCEWDARWEFKENRSNFWKRGKLWKGFWFLGKFNFPSLQCMHVTASPAYPKSRLFLVRFLRHIFAYIFDYTLLLG